MELVRYLHLNPARLRHPQDPWRYPWSSHGQYLGKLGPVHVEAGTVLESFHRQVGPARQAYRQFLRAGLSQGHQAQYYETVDQRFLGDERFLGDIQRKTALTHEVTVEGPKVPFSRLLPAVAQTTGISIARLLRAGRQRDGVESRAFLVYAAREWSGLTVKELGRRLHRDPSMVSRLYSRYLARRNSSLETQVQAIITKKVNTHA